VQIFRSLGTNSLINTLKSHLLASLSVSDWVDSLIGPGGLRLVVSHLFAVPVVPLSVRLEKKYVSKTSIYIYIYLHGHILSTIGDVLILQ
jgi:hypothetical protein